MDKIDPNILNYYLQNVRGFIRSQKKVQAFPGIEKNIENILVEIAVHHTYSCENLDDVSKTILEHIKTELIKNRNQFELTCTFQELKCGTRSLIYTKHMKHNTMKEVSPMRQPLSMMEPMPMQPMPMQPLRKPNSITAKTETPSSLISTSFKLRCLNSTLKFVKDESTMTLRYPDMASEQADFIVNMFQQSNVDSDIGLGYKTMYAPLWEAMKIFGLKYKFTLRHGEPKISDMKCLILDKLPIISKSDKTNQDQQTNTSSIILTSTDNFQKTTNNDNKLRKSKNDDEKQIKKKSDDEKEIKKKKDEKQKKKNDDEKFNLKNCNSNMSSCENLNAKTYSNIYPNLIDTLVYLGPTYITNFLKKIYNFVMDQQSASLIIQTLSMQEVQIVKNFRTICTKPKYLPYLNENSKILAKNITEKLDEKSLKIDVKIDNLRFSEKGKIKKCKRLKNTIVQNATLRKILVPRKKKAKIMSSPTSLDSSMSSSSIISSNSSTSKQSLNSLSSINSQFSSVLNLNDNEKSIKSLGTSMKSVATPSNIYIKPATNKNNDNGANLNNIKIIPTNSSNSTTNVTSSNKKPTITSSNSTTSVTSSNIKPTSTSSNSTTSVTSSNIKPTSSNSTSSVTKQTIATSYSTTSVTKQTIASSNSTTSVTKQTITASNSTTSVTKPTMTSSNSTTSVTKPTMTSSNSTTSVTKQAITSSHSTSSVTKPTMTSSNSTTSVTKQAITSSNSTSSVTKPTMMSSNSTTSVTKQAITSSNSTSSVTKPTMTSSNSTTSATKQAITSSNSTSSVTKPTMMSSNSTTSVTKQAITSSNSTSSVTKQTITSSNSTTSVASSNNTKPGNSSSNSAITAPSGRTLNKTKQKLLDGLNQPVVADKATKMMLNMGWSGGGLGAREEGITSPLVPGIDYFFENKPRLGLGGLEILEQIRAQKQQQQLKQQTKTKKSQPQQQLSKREYHIISLETILRLLINYESYREIELPDKNFDKEWAFVKHLMICFNSGCRQHLNDERQIELVNVIGCIMASGSWYLYAEAYYEQSIIVFFKQQIGPLLDNIKVEGDTITVYSINGSHMKKIILNNYNNNPNNIRITINNNPQPNNIKTEGDSTIIYSNDGKSMKKIPVNNNKKQIPPPLKPIMLKSEAKDKNDFQNFTNLNDLTKKDQKSKQLIPLIPKAPESDKCDKTCASLSSIPINFKSNFLAHVLLFCKQDVEHKNMKFLNENEKKYIMKTMSMIRNGDKCMESPLERRFHEKIQNEINGYSVEFIFTTDRSITLTKKFNSKANRLLEDGKEHQNNNCKCINNNNIICDNNNRQPTDSSQTTNSSQVVDKNDQEVENILINAKKYKSIDDLETSLLIRSVESINNDIDKLIDNAQIVSSSSQVVKSSSQDVNKSSQVVNNNEPFINDIDKKMDEIPVVIANDEEEYLLLTDDDFTKNGLAKELQELRDLYDEKKTENDVTKNVNIKTEPKSTEDIPKEIKVENIKREFTKGPSPGKRSRSESESPTQISKISKSYAKKIAIVPKDYPQETITQQTAREIQILIKDSIDNYDSCSNLELPLLKCDGLQNGELLYCCFSEKSFYFIEDLLRESDFKIIYGMSKECPGIRMTLRINSFFVENTELTLKRLAKYNKGLCTKEWKVIKRLFAKDCDLFLIEIDEDSYNYIRKAHFSLFAGIDKVLFNHYGD